jgi:hypothetical protein
MSYVAQFWFRYTHIALFDVLPRLENVGAAILIMQPVLVFPATQALEKPKLVVKTNLRLALTTSFHNENC